MKTRLIILFLSICSFFTQAASTNTPPPTVIVQKLAVAMPHDEAAREEFLWKGWSAKELSEQKKAALHTKKLDLYTTENWKPNFTAFAQALVEEAAEQKLDSGSLQKVLDAILKHSKDKTAYLPTGAYETTLEGAPIWLVTVKWEYVSMQHVSELGHICIFAFDQKTLKQVGFVSCG